MSDEINGFDISGHEKQIEEVRTYLIDLLTRPNRSNWTSDDATVLMTTLAEWLVREYIAMILDNADDEIPYDRSAQQVLGLFLSQLTHEVTDPTARTFQKLLGDIDEIGPKFGTG